MQRTVDSRRSTGLGRAVVVSAALVGLIPAACTSITWEDSGGVQHHLGLVAVEVLEEDGARVVRRFALGSDLDVSRGGAWTLGFSRTEKTHVFESQLRDPRALQRAFLEELEAEGATSPPRRTWHFFHATDPDSSRAVIDRRTLVGLDVSTGPVLRGLFVGFADGTGIDPAVLGEDAVLHVGRRPGADSRYRLWRLMPERAQPQ